jgi:hypothetical protein
VSQASPAHTQKETSEKRDPQTKLKLLKKLPHEVCCIPRNDSLKKKKKKVGDGGKVGE